LVYSVLAFTRPKASREVEQLNRNWTQEHKSVWCGPRSKATGHSPRSVRDWPVPKLDHRPARRRARKLRPQAIAQTSARGPWGLSQNRPICNIFRNFFTLRVEIFWMFFDPYEP